MLIVTEIRSEHRMAYPNKNRAWISDNKWHYEDLIFYLNMYHACMNKLLRQKRLRSTKAVDFAF